jgi:hypothetical protein
MGWAKKRSSGSALPAAPSPACASPSPPRTAPPSIASNTHAIKAGGQDNGPPGLRHLYHPNYYGAFVLDPDGHNIEAVYHGTAP